MGIFSSLIGGIRKGSPIMGKKMEQNLRSGEHEVQLGIVIILFGNGWRGFSPQNLWELRRQASTFIVPKIQEINVWIRDDFNNKGLIGKGGGSNKGKATLAPRLKITVPRFNNSELMRSYLRTLVGRCMNPMLQDINSLLFMLLRIWKVEDRVSGADLGMGRFQFDFDEENDIKAVLAMEPYHFNEDKQDGGGVSYRGALNGTGTSKVSEQETKHSNGVFLKGKGKVSKNRDVQRIHGDKLGDERIGGSRMLSRPVLPRERRYRQGGSLRAISRGPRALQGGDQCHCWCGSNEGALF
ncbi:unnamed protein product [Thlaspi arvense]|uniref:DUF4283 domain-containing protein n=1 Tax=Thlaspi arvense TaxID=13288 RepID=A0AAU9RWD3_THLAR|nr:unnamed protein product [Thlaspi arvense]